jgi:hypothetical protein
MKLTLSNNMSHTWFVDLDGTVLVHNGSITQPDRLLPGTREFWDSIPGTDVIVITTARPRALAEKTLEFLEDNDLRFDYAIFDLPVGERIVVNDVKPQGLKTALAVNLTRDAGPNIEIELDNTP